jgi:hypothetical protein
LFIIFSRLKGKTMASFTIVFKNNTNEELKGVALEVYGSSGQRLYVDGVRPVGPQSQNLFRYQDCDAVAQWRFLASINYSDDPDNLRVVLIDTGRRAKTKCDYEISLDPTLFSALYVPSEVEALKQVIELKEKGSGGHPISTAPFLAKGKVI